MIVAFWKKKQSSKQDSLLFFGMEIWKFRTILLLKMSASWFASECATSTTFSLTGALLSMRIWATSSTGKIASQGRTPGPPHPPRWIVPWRISCTTWRSISVVYASTFPERVCIGGDMSLRVSPTRTHSSLQAALLVFTKGVMEGLYSF